MSLSAKADTNTYLTVKVVRVNSERTVVGSGIHIYIEHDKATFSVRLREKSTYKLDWAVDDPIEFRLSKDANTFCKKPNGKEMRSALLDQPKVADLTGPGDLPFPSRVSSKGLILLEYLRSTGREGVQRLPPEEHNSRL